MSSFHPLRISSLCTFPTPHVSGFFSIPSTSSFPSLAQGSSMECRRSPSQEHFILSSSVDFICISKSNLNSSSYFQIPEFSAIRSNHTHSMSGILFPDDPRASRGVIIFVMQGLSFSDLSTSFLFSLDPYSNCVDVNISINNSSFLSLLNVYTPYILSSPTNSKADSFFLHSFLLQKFSHSGGLQMSSSPLGLKRYF